MQRIEVHVLGPLSVTAASGAELHLPAAVRHFVALVVAAGHSGLSKEHLATELWPIERPPSWKSAIRNRVTAARRHLGADTILTVSNRYRLADTVSVDAWVLMQHQGHDNPHDAAAMLERLRRQPFEGIAISPLIEASRREIQFARSAYIRTTTRRTDLLLPASLAALRLYQRDHALDPVVTEATVRAHVKAEDVLTAQDLIESTREAALQLGVSTEWIEALNRSLDRPTAVPFSTANIAADHDLAQPLAPSIAQRAELFAESLAREEWNVAFEIASGQLAYIAPLEGDQDRVELLKQIPTDKLDHDRRLQLARFLAADGRILDPELAQEQSRVVEQLATTGDEMFLAAASAALAGDVEDERALMHLPVALTDSTVPATNLNSYQVGVTNYLERASAAQAQPVFRRFCELVEDSDDPLRRWHVLVLTTTNRFCQGDWSGARDHAKRACEYGGLFHVAEADFVWRSQMFNTRWVQSTMGMSGTSPSEFFPGHGSFFGQAFDAAERASTNDVESFLADFTIDGKMTFSVPLLAMLAPYVDDSDLKQRLIRRLTRRTGTSAIFGAGCAHFGPVDRTCAQLSVTDPEKLGFLRSAVAVADSQQTRLWQVVCRLELAAFTRDKAMHADAARLATTPTLQSFVEFFGSNESVPR